MGLTYHEQLTDPTTHDSVTVSSPSTAGLEAQVQQAMFEIFGTTEDTA